jgi:N-methylhydantoinase B
MTTTIDAITVSVIQHRLHAIVAEMGEAMLRTSYSQILNSSRDFSTAILDPDGRLIAQAEHVPIHVGALPWAVMAVRDFFGDGVKPGDVFLLNDPYSGNNHLPDLTAFVPVFGEGRLLFWSVNRSHQSDIGGATHGAYNPGATEIWQEGLRITPLKLYEEGVLREDVMRMIVTNVRHPRDFRGDLAAMIGSARVGERRLQALLAEHGVKEALAGVEAVLDAAERRTRACIATWKDGVFRGEALIDDDGRGHQDLWIRAVVTKKGSDLTVDITDASPQTTSFINSSYANMRASVAMALAYLIDPDIPKNDGAFRAMQVIAREGTIAWSKAPAPVTLCTNCCAQEIGEAVIKALSKSCPDRAMAGWGRRFRIAIQGTNPRNGRQFIWHMFQGRPGGGASSAGDGWPGAGEWQAAGGIKFGSIEVTEVRFPLFFKRHEFRPDSGGDGRYRGGPGGDLEFVVETTEPARANTAGDGVRHGACGMSGGVDGKPHFYRLVSKGKTRVLKTKEVGIDVPAGATFLVLSGGGGGWGDPRKRTAAEREAEVATGFVTGTRGAHAGRAARRGKNAKAGRAR